MEADEYLVHGSLALTRGSLLRIDDGREMRVHVCVGCVWITQEGDRRDVVLNTGESICLASAGRTLILAIGGGCVVALASPYKTCFARRIDRVHAGVSLPVYHGESGWRGAMAALRTRLVKAWIGLYATPPRRAGYVL